MALESRSTAVRPFHHAPFSDPPDHEIQKKKKRYRYFLLLCMSVLLLLFFEEEEDIHLDDTNACVRAQREKRDSANDPLCVIDAMTF